MNKNNFVFIILLFLIMFGIVFGIYHFNGESPKHIEKTLNGLSDDDYLLTYTKNIDNPSYVGEINNISIIIYNDGRTNIKYNLFNCDLKDEKFKDILPYTNQNLNLTKEQINKIKEMLVLNNFTKIEQGKEERNIIGENYTSYINIALGNNIYTKGGNCKYFSNDYILLEDLIYECVNPHFIENIGIIVEKLEMLDLEDEKFENY